MRSRPDGARAAVLALLHADQRDIGCGATYDVLDVYVDRVVAGTAPRMPGVAAHLGACAPCADDLTGLLMVTRAAAITGAGCGPSPSG